MDMQPKKKTMDITFLFPPFKKKKKILFPEGFQKIKPYVVAKMKRKT